MPRTLIETHLGKLNLRAVVARDARLVRFREHLESRYGAERAQEAVERLVVGAFDDVTGAMLHLFETELRGINDVRIQLQARYTRMYKLFENPGGVVESLPPELTPPHLNSLFEDLDRRLDALSHKVSRDGVHEVVEGFGPSVTAESLSEPPVAEQPAGPKPPQPPPPSVPAPGAPTPPAAPAPPRVGSRSPLLLPDARTANTGVIRSILYNLTRDNRVEVAIIGRLHPSLIRQGPLASARNFNTESLWARLRAEHSVPDWQAAHLWGPRWGDEAAAGIMLAPEQVNQIWQNRGVERFLDELRNEAVRRGGEIELRAVATSHVRTLEGGSGSSFLSHAQYEFSIVGSEGAPVKFGFVDFSVGEPPVGKVSDVHVSTATAGGTR
ncbi:polymorphic toxin type 4 domain-containing protein [Nocardia thraciensis]